MNNIFFDRFSNREGVGKKYANVTDEIMQKYHGIFKIDNDETLIIEEIWKYHGFSQYRNGLFCMVNPDEYSPCAWQFPNISTSAIVFARTNIGGLFLFDKLNIGDSILYLNIHKGERKIVATNFDVFFGFNLGADSFWNRECYGKIELKVMEKFGEPKFDECYTFEPALALGGSESVAKMKKVKLKEHLELLAQIHSGG
jgi:hypothetical protein